MSEVITDLMEVLIAVMVICDPPGSDKEELLPEADDQSSLESPSVPESPK